MTSGQELAEARRKLGLSLEEVAWTINVPVEQLQAIEASDPGWMPASPDAQTAIRAYASAVQLDAGQLVSRYASQLPIVPNVEQSLAAFESEGDEPATPVAAIAVTQVTPPTGPARPRMFVYESQPAILPFDPDLDTFQTNDPDYDGRGWMERHVSDARFPVAALVFVSALAVTGGFLLGANREADLRETLAAFTSERAKPAGDAQVARLDEPAAPAAEATAPPDPSSPAPSTGSTTTDRVPERAQHGLENASRSAPPPSTPDSAPRAAPADTMPAVRAPDNNPPAARPAETPAPSAFIVVPGASTTSAPEAASEPVAAGPLSGAWNVVVQTASQNEAPGTDTPTYRLQLEQRGTRIVGSAHRAGEGGSGGRSLSVAGTFSGGRLTLDVTGADRARFVLYRGGGDWYLGRVRRASGRSSGSTIVKLERPATASAR